MDIVIVSRAKNFIDGEIQLFMKIIFEFFSAVLRPELTW